LMLECPHGCMHDQFCIKFPNHHCCMCVMEIMWDIPFIPESLAKPTPWHISCSAVLQAFWAKTSNHHKPWPKKKIPNQRSEDNKKEKKKIPDQRLGENKEKRKSPIKDNERIIQKGLWTRQYLNNTKLSQVNKEWKETTTWGGPLPLISNQKACALTIFSPRTKQKQKRKMPKHSEPNSSQKHYSQEKVLLIHDHVCNLWFDRKWFAESSHDISMVRN